MRRRETLHSYGTTTQIYIKGTAHKHSLSSYLVCNPRSREAVHHWNVPKPDRCPPWSTHAPTPLCPKCRRNPKGFGMSRGQRGSHLHRSVWGRRCGGATWTPTWLCWEKPGIDGSRAATVRWARAALAAWSRPSGLRLYAATGARWVRRWNPSWRGESNRMWQLCNSSNSNMEVEMGGVAHQAMCRPHRSTSSWKAR